MNNLMLGKQPPLLREVAGMIFGIVFILTGGYSGLEFIFGLLIAPLLYAGVIRLVVFFYRLVGLVLNVPLICSILALVALGGIFTAVAGILKISVGVGIAAIIVLVFAEAWFFVRDVKAAFLHRSQKV